MLTERACMHNICLNDVVKGDDIYIIIRSSVSSNDTVWQKSQGSD